MPRVVSSRMTARSSNMRTIGSGPGVLNYCIPRCLHASLPCLRHGVYFHSHFSRHPHTLAQLPFSIFIKPSPLFCLLPLLWETFGFNRLADSLPQALAQAASDSGSSMYLVARSFRSNKPTLNGTLGRLSFSETFWNWVVRQPKRPMDHWH